jgi:hypothetical protein
MADFQITARVYSQKWFCAHFTTSRLSFFVSEHLSTIFKCAHNRTTAVKEEKYWPSQASGVSFDTIFMSARLCLCPFISLGVLFCCCGVSRGAAQRLFASATVHKFQQGGCARRVAA